MQQSNSLCFAVNPPPFDKGGKCDGAEQGDYCPFTMIAGMARVDATGGASPSPYEKREGQCNSKQCREYKYSHSKAFNKQQDYIKNPLFFYKQRILILKTNKR